MTAVTLTITEVRSNPTVNFITEDWNLIKYVQKYNHFRKRNDPPGWTTSPDLLTRTISHTFNSTEDLITYVNDPLVAARIILIDAHNAANGIIATKIES
jgi:hypothetical protein